MLLLMVEVFLLGRSSHESSLLVSALLLRQAHPYTTTFERRFRCKRRAERSCRASTDNAAHVQSRAWGLPLVIDLEVDRRLQSTLVVLP